MRFILASQSPQRKKILEALGLTFEVVPAHIDEHHAGLNRPHLIVQSIAERKALAVAQRHVDAWIIACDTIVVLKDGTIALKPENKGIAKQVIQSYRKAHCTVYSGLVLLNKGKKVGLKGYEKSVIYFGDYSDAEIEAYLKIGRWKESSGSLTIEEVGDWVRRIEGDYSNIVGLPVNLLKKLMKEAALI